MELDQLKSQLNSRMKTARQERSAAEIASMLAKDTGSVIQKIRRSLRIELASAIAFTVACGLVAIFTGSWVYKTYCGIFFFVGVAFIFLLAILLKKTLQVSNVAPVKANLHSLVLVLKQYVKRYLQLGMALLPACFVLAYWLSYHDPSRTAKPFRWDIFGYLVAYLVVAGTVIYYFSRWYLQKLYGNYIRQLEEMETELEE